MYSWTKRQKPQAELLHDSRYMQETPDQHHLPRTFSRTSQLLGDTPGNVTDWGFKLLGDLGLKSMWELVIVSMSIISAPWSSQSQTKGYQPCGTRVASWNESNLRWLQGKRRCFPFPIVRYPVILARMELNFPHSLSIPATHPGWVPEVMRHAAMATFLCHPSVSLGFETLAMKTWERDAAWCLPAKIPIRSTSIWPRNAVVVCDIHQYRFY